MKTKYVTLTYDPGREGGPWFMSTKLTESPRGKGEYEMIQFVRGEPGELFFKIATDKIKFREDQPFVITAPQSGGDIEQFSKPKGGNKTIKVANRNEDQTATNYEYDLHFDNGTSLDPIIQNGCCRYPLTDTGGKMSLLNDSGAINALLVVAILIFVTAFRRRWARL